ncbi:hypothetical protein IT408_01570 [Candidatus Uhrbacteria bacterium]|nr:hypothetical protein [Candidatus Uhrbacteria bacterium]
MKNKVIISGLLLCATIGGGCAKKSEIVAPQVQAPIPQVEKTTEIPNTNTSATTPTETAAPTLKPATKLIPKPVQKPVINTKPTPAYQIVNIYATGMSPKIIAVFEGDGVTWINKDQTNHAIRSDNALLWDSGNIPAGGKYSHVFPATGTYTYSDGTNQAKGTVVVNARPK